ncbi:MAG: hypothetical protein V2I33_19735 [Kangiellaceae bacterium]|jgi:hypothetical protein|nr:hypothetical protein [Kangiellaceae bacterium]
MAGKSPVEAQGELKPSASIDSEAELELKLEGISNRLGSLEASITNFATSRDEIARVVKSPATDSVVSSVLTDPEAPPQQDSQISNEK